MSGKIAQRSGRPKRTGTQVRKQWGNAKEIYRQVHALESFTGGDGDGDYRPEDGDSKGTILEKLGGRLLMVHSHKPNVDPQRKVKSAEVYYNWIQGGEDSWYKRMHEQ